MLFSDLDSKLKAAREVATLFAPKTLIKGTDLSIHINNVVAKAQKTVINTHGKFYGLRSKYDGKGNLRQSMKA